MRTEQAETRTELAKTRTEQAEIRTEQAETRTEQAETALQRVVNKEIQLSRKFPPGSSKKFPCKRLLTEKPARRVDGASARDTQLIAEARTPKQIAEILKVSPKTVEYHRMKLMTA